MYGGNDDGVRYTSKRAAPRLQFNHAEKRGERDLIEKSRMWKGAKINRSKKERFHSSQFDDCRGRRKRDLAGGIPWSEEFGKK